MGENISARMARVADARELLRIYTPYVRDTAATFEWEAPSVEEFKHRIESALRRYPYLVIEEDGRIAGYAYASPFRERAAYSWAVETTIYISQDCRSRGLGKRLYLALEETLSRQNIINLNACIAYTSVADDHLDNASASFHEPMGYRRAGYFSKCGYKFGNWYDMVWMENLLKEHPQNPDPFIPVREIAAF